MPRFHLLHTALLLTFFLLTGCSESDQPEPSSTPETSRVDAQEETSAEPSEPEPASPPTVETTPEAVADSKSSAPTAAESLETQLAQLEVPPPWLESVNTSWDTSKPWKEARIEIRRLLGKTETQREGIKLTWVYLQKDDIGNGHEYPMYLFLGNEVVWAVKAYREWLEKPHENTPLFGLKALAAIYAEYGMFDEAKTLLDKGMNNLPEPPWRVMRTAEFHDAYGDLFVKWSKLDEAKQSYEEAIRLYPTAKPKYGGHLLPRRAKKVQSKLDLLSFGSLAGKSLKEGRYTETALGYAGDINLTVTVSGGRVTKMDVKHKEKIEQNASVIIPRRIIDRQSLQVDGISGATITKDAIVGGTFRALKKAGLE